MATSSPAARRTRAVESFKTAADCIGTITPGMALFALTRGQFSMIDAVLACLDQIGEADLSIWTWTVAEYEIATLTRLRMDHRLRSGRLVIDYGARHKNAGLIAEWRGTFGHESVRYVVNHAKIATIRTPDYKLLLRGSMNLNFNPRFEQFDLTEGGPDFDLVAGIEAELPILAPDASGAEVYAATRLDAAFSQTQLLPFRGVKPWAK